jgi:hypothetical protein
VLGVLTFVMTRTNIPRDVGFNFVQCFRVKVSSLKLRTVYTTMNCNGKETLVLIESCTANCITDILSHLRSLKETNGEYNIPGLFIIKTYPLLYLFLWIFQK